jgi:hypothetical protein
MRKFFLLWCRADNGRLLLATAASADEAMRQLGISPAGPDGSLWETFDIPTDALKQLMAGQIQYMTLQAPRRHRTSRPGDSGGVGVQTDRPVTTQGIDRILRFLPIFEQEGYRFSERPPDDSDFLSSPEYNQDVLDFLRTLEEEGFMCALDWAQWQPVAERYIRHPELIEDADLDTLRKLLTAHMHKNRLSTGHLEGMLLRGHIVALLRRLKTLRALMRNSA